MGANFGGLTKEFAQYQTAKIVILPIPFDKNVSWLKGAAKGPQAIIAASQQVELYDIETNSEVYRQGIFTHKPIKAESSKKMISQAYAKTLLCLKDNKFVVTLGGDHSIAIGPITAHKDFYKDTSILHLDAHADRRDDYNHNKFSHASVMARASEVVDNIVSVGIRSMVSCERSLFKPGSLFLAEKICGDDNGWISKVIEKLSKKVYVSLDVDVFDIGLMPSTGTPEPGGMNWYQVLHLLCELFKTKEVIGVDVVELAPMLANKAPNSLVAKLIYKILSYKFKFQPGLSQNYFAG